MAKPRQPPAVILKVIEDFRKPITQEQRDRYEQVKKYHYQVSPFYAHLFLYLQDTLAKRLPGGFPNLTSATDGKIVAVNPDFLDGLSIQEGDTLLCHEVLHVMFKHPWRRPKLLQAMEAAGLEKCSMCCNMAEDLAINNVLLEDKKPPMPSGWEAFDPQFKGKKTEEILPYVYKKYHKQHQCPECQKQKQGKKDDQGEGGSGSEGQEGPSEGSQSTQDPGGTQGKGKGRGRSSGPQDASGGPSPDNCPGHGGGCCQQAEDTSQAEQERIDREIDEAVLKASRAAKSRGNVPAFAEILLNEITKPKIRWQEKLRQWFDARVPADYSWARPSRQGMSQGVYLPSFKVDSLGEVVILVDTSGSTQEMLPEFLAEMKAIFLECRPFRLHVIYVDCEVAGHDVYERADEFDIKMKGGGGTSFRPGFDYIREKGLEPRGIIYFTDLYGDWPQLEDPGIETLFVCPMPLASIDKGLIGSWGTLVTKED